MQIRKARITEIARGHVRLAWGDKSVTVQGEGYARGFGSPDFVVYRDSIQHWDPPNSEIQIDELTREAILATLLEQMSAKSLSVEIE